MKNQNHEFNNIQQYILQIQKEKQELQNQLVNLVQNADTKRIEIERLQKELKQLKEEYFNQMRQEETFSANLKDRNSALTSGVDYKENVDDKIKNIESTKKCKNEQQTNIETSKNTDSMSNAEYELQTTTSGTGNFILFFNVFSKHFFHCRYSSIKYGLG